jgi:SAM-dependent methyltransferase
MGNLGMKKYLCQDVDSDRPELVSVIDDLPLWSSPFGLRLLDTIIMKKNIRALDIGCGTGFPLVEIAERLGDTCKVHGIDPWEQALDRVREKLTVYDIDNVELVTGRAEDMPFDSGCFDLIVSNNGINNVSDMTKTIQECRRVLKPGSQMVLTMNLDNTMEEFYSVFLQVLSERGLQESIFRVKEHIYSRRKPLAEVTGLLETGGFAVRQLYHDTFKLRFVDATTMLNHYLIRFWFIGGWRDAVDQEHLTDVFEATESRLNKQAERDGEMVLTVPFVTIDCVRQIDQ